MSENNDRSDVDFRIQERMLREVRQELGVERAKVKILKERVEEEEETARICQDLLYKEREEFIEKLDEKNAKIEMLKERVDNVNGEFNRILGGPAKQPKPQDPNKATTLEDVYRLTGEHYSKDR